MSTPNQYYNGSVHVEVDGVEYDVDLNATAYYHYSPGTMYRRNGDPGDPPEEDFEIDDFEIESILDEYGDDVTSKYDEDDEFKVHMDSTIMSALRDVQFEYTGFDRDE